MKIRWLLIPMLFVLSSPVLAEKAHFFQGVNYEAVTPAQPTDVKPGQIEVIEFFWYGCPHCYALEPYVVAWEKTLPKDVVFKRIPAAMPGSEFYTDAQATFTAEVLGIGEKIREPFFDAIHAQHQVELATDVDALRTFFGKYGVSPKDFDATWNSFAVQTRMAQANQMANRYSVQGVPTIIVNGKWKTGAGYQMESADIMRCVNFLIDQERATMKSPSKK
ncbi:MAG: thiol:disulfide interchange protein DsbA/DsbL [Bacillota bacterium]